MDLLFVLLMRSAAAVVPALKIGLAGTCNAQRTGRNVLGDSRTGSRKRTVAQLDRRNEVGIAADEAVVTDLGAVLVIAVVVDNDRAAAEVDALAAVAVADVGEVRDLRAVSDDGVLDLHKVADLDVVAVGAVLDAVGADFERYWNSPLAYPLRDLLAPDHPRLELGSTPAADAATLRYLEALAQSDLLQHLQAGHLPLEWAPARLLSDAPDKILDRAPPDKTLLAPLYQAMTETRHTLTLVSPYFVPGRQGAAALAALARRGVSVSVLTNALAATDVSAVHAGYARYRKGLLRAGVRLYELKPGSTVGGGRLGLPGRSGTSLHAKTFALDEAQLFVGSFNLDPRSAELNTEMGLLIDSPALARSLDRKSVV